MDELLAQFLVEGPELIQQASDALMILERSPTNTAAVDDAFRAIHTLKGSVGLFDLPAMGVILHHAEDLLGAVRSGNRPIDAATVSRLLSVLGQTERWLGRLEESGALPADSPAVAEALVRPLTAASPIPAPAQRAGEQPQWALDLLARLPATIPPGLMQAIHYFPLRDAYFSGDDPMAILAGVPDVAYLELAVEGEAPGGPYDPFVCRLRIEAVSRADPAAIRAALRFVQDQVWIAPIILEAASAARPAERGADKGSRSLRVDVARIDALSAVTAELIAAKTALSSAVASADGATSTGALINAIAAHAASIDRLTNRIHDGVSALRMAPIGPVLRRFPRIVREIADTLGKDIEVVVDDGAVQADKSIVEGLSEPLTHLLRNAVDHGIETREARMKSGKPARGRIVLTASEAGGRLLLRIEDDGSGIDPVTIGRLAVQRGLVDDIELQAMGPHEVLDLIFMPGFSTAQQVTDLSGRGVGMDAVRTTIRGLGGRVSLSSELGRGTTITLSLPIAVSLTKVMVVADGVDRYGLALDGVLEALRVRATDVAPIRDGHAFNWRNRAVPLLPLSAVTGGGGRLGTGDQRVVVIRAGGQPVGLSIDRIEEHIDVAMRPLGGLLTGMPGIRGTALLGDGQVLMILDTEGLGL